MVKIGNNKYQCEGCLKEIDYIKRTAGKPREYGGDPSSRSAGHSRVSDQLICPYCYHKYVSQRWPDGTK